jgi:hypothetical protein
MSRTMKLDRVLALAAILVASFAIGCGAPAGSQLARAPKAPIVATTQLMAAEISDTDEAPRVGKSQHATSLTEDDEKDSPKRHDDRRPGGGFSGYK